MDKRTHAEKISTGNVLNFSGRRYRNLSTVDGGVNSIELLETGAAVQEINTRLRNELRSRLSDYFACPTPGMRINGKDDIEEKPDYFTAIEPVFWNDRWITLLQKFSSDCGGRPYSGFTFSTWDLTTGKSINPWTWIKQSKKKNASPEYDNYYFNYAAPEELNKIIATKAIKSRLTYNPKEAQEDPNCLDVYSENTEYQLSLGKHGLIFSHNFPYVTQACADNIEIPYPILLRFLTKEGKAAVKSIMKTSSDPIKRNTARQ